MNAEEVNEKLAPTRKRLYTYDSLIMGALAAGGMATVIQLTGREKLDIYLQGGLFLFAVGIPFCIANFVILHRAQETSAPVEVVHNWASLIVLIFGPLLEILGFIAVFTHFNKYIGLAFAVAAFIAFLVLHIAISRLDGYYYRLHD